MFNNKGINRYKLIHNMNEGFTKYLIKYIHYYKFVSKKLQKQKWDKHQKKA